jgi:hypothetical protein
VGRPIGRAEVGRDRETAQLGRPRLDPITVSGGEGDTRALPRQGLADCPPKSLAATADERSRPTQP